MMNSSPRHGDDDKLAKAQHFSPGGHLAFQKHQEVRSFFRDIVAKAVPAFAKKDICFLGFFVLMSAALYTWQGGHWSEAEGGTFGRWVSVLIEVLGLLVLRHKIEILDSVKGLSGNTMAMYAVVYLIRMWVATPWSDDQDQTKAGKSVEACLGFASLLLVLDILYSVFVRHRKSYQVELDVLKVHYLIAGCFVAAALLRPQFPFWTSSYSFWWSWCLYMDVLALMPQVVMMAQGDGNVEAPVAHFVAATAISRMEDIWDSLTVHANLRSDWSFWINVFVQLLNVLLVADFVYYYMKARFSGSKDMGDMIV